MIEHLIESREQSFNYSCEYPSKSFTAGINGKDWVGSSPNWIIKFSDFLILTSGGGI